MKQKRLLAILLILVFSFTLLVSCKDDELAFTDVYLTNPTSNSTSTALAKATDATTLTALNGTPYSSSNSYPLYVVTTEENSITAYHIYNPDLDKIVLTAAETENTSVSLTLTFYDYFLVKITNTETDKVVKTSFYSADGTLVATEDKDVSITDYSPYQPFTFGNQLLDKVDKNKYRKICDIPALFGSVGKLGVTEHYLIKYDTDEKSLIYYDHSLNIKASYRFPSYVDEPQPFLLADESVLLQYSLQEVDDAEEYDYVSEGNKYSLFHLRFDPVANETEDLDIGEVVLYEVFNTLTELDFAEFVNTENVPNIVAYYKIENKRVNTSRFYSNVLTEDCALGAAMDNYVAGQESFAEPYAGMYKVKLTNGYGLLDADGTLKKVVNTLPSKRAFGFYDYNNKAIYNADFELEYTIPASATIEESASDGILFTDTDNDNNVITYLYTKTGLKTILSATDTTKSIYRSDAKYFVIFDTATEMYTYYSIDGTLLFSDDKVYTRVAPGASSILLRASTGSNTYVYKCLTA